MDQAKNTLGEIVSQLIDKPIDNSDASVMEVGGQRHAHYEPIFLKKLEELKKEFPPNRDFYIEVHYLIPYLTYGTGDQWKIIGRFTCPSPTFDQVVYIYHRASDDVELIWSIPHITACVDIDNHFLELPIEQRQLANWVMEFKHGVLYRNAKKINIDIEKPDKATDSLLLI